MTVKTYMRQAWFTSVTALFLVAGAAQAAITSVAVEPRTPGTYELNWASDQEGGQVSIYVASQPNAPAAERTLLLQKSTSGKEVVQVATEGRPYFYVVDQDGKGLWAGERVLPLEGGRNFRDLGGYPAADGRRVKWGKVFRSGSMAKLTPADYEYLSNIGIKVVCDFRSTVERASEPNAWAQATNLEYWARDYDMGFGDFTAITAKGVTAQQVQDAMTDGYRQTPDQQAEGYREMFRQLLAGEVPLAFNCSAGKDRAGVAAALLLSALGVPRDIVVEDYALSDKIVDFQAELVEKGKDGALGFLSHFPPEVIAPLMKTDPAYIQATFEAVEAKYGSVEAYFEKALGLTQNDLVQLRAQLLE